MAVGSFNFGRFGGALAIEKSNVLLISLPIFAPVTPEARARTPSLPP